MGFSRQEYWSGLLCPPPRDLPKPRIKPASLVSPALAGVPVPPENPQRAQAAAAAAELLQSCPTLCNPLSYLSESAQIVFLLLSEEFPESHSRNLTPCFKLLALPGFMT